MQALQRCLTTMATPRDGMQKRCYLLELPRELRDDIYHRALHQPNGVTVKLYKTFMPATNILALMSTCKQIRQECGNIFFDINELILEASIGPALKSSCTLKSFERDCQSFLDRFCQRLSPIAGPQGVAKRFHGIQVLADPKLLLLPEQYGFQDKFAWSGLAKAVATLLQQNQSLRVCWESTFSNCEHGPLYFFDLPFSTEMETIAKLKTIALDQDSDWYTWDLVIRPLEQWVGSIFEMSEEMKNTKPSSLQSNRVPMRDGEV
jgi:hypothetical protein